MTRQYLLLLVLVLSFGCAPAPDPSPAPLFNGVDLAGWVNVNGAPETWTVRDSMIVCSGHPFGMLRTLRMYENFVVELEWRHLVPGGNAGLFIHSDPLPAVGSPFSRTIEAQILDGTHGDLFAMNGARLTPDRSDPTWPPRSLPTEQHVKPLGEWNHYRLESRDGRITLAVNGVEVNGGSDAFPQKGYVALESEGAEAHFRNIRLTELPGAPEDPEKTAEHDAGFVGLYNGVDLRGWRTESAPLREPVEGWEVDGWRLRATGTSSPTLHHVATLGQFEFFFDFRLMGDSTGTDHGALAIGAGSENLVRFGSGPAGSGAVVTGGSVSEPATRADNPVGTWNRLTVHAGGGKLTVRLNGVSVNEAPFSNDASLSVGFVRTGPPFELANPFVRDL